MTAVDVSPEPVAEAVGFGVSYEFTTSGRDYQSAVDQIGHDAASLEAFAQIRDPAPFKRAVVALFDALRPAERHIVDYFWTVSIKADGSGISASIVQGDLVPLVEPVPADPPSPQELERNLLQQAEIDRANAAIDARVADAVAVALANKTTEGTP